MKWWHWVVIGVVVLLACRTVMGRQTAQQMTDTKRMPPNTKA